MILRSTKLLLIASALAAGAGMASAQSNDGARASAPAAADVRKAMEQFNAKRDATLASRQELMNQLKGATEQERKIILEKLQAQQKELLETQRALGKQIRDDMRKQRESLKPGG